MHDIETALTQLFNEKPSPWYGNSIESLIKRWEDIVDKNGEYILD
jgi:hypothetical protein